MKPVMISILIIFVGMNNVSANQYTKNCYNCDYRKTIVKRYYNNPVIVVPAKTLSRGPTLFPGPPVVLDMPTAYPVIPMRCVWYPDPYTFLGEIFGYDFIPICQ